MIFYKTNPFNGTLLRTFEETAINFLTRLEQKANEARNYDIRISERKFLCVLLNNMKHHKYYEERIASFLIVFAIFHFVQ